MTVGAVETVNHGEVSGSEKYSGSTPVLLSAIELHAAPKIAHANSRHVPETSGAHVDRPAGRIIRQLAM